MRTSECAACGATDNLQFHHLVPRSLGGSDEDANLITLCGGCHAKAHGARANWGHADLTRRALGAKKARGERVGAVPYGYTLAIDGATLEPDPTEQAVITEARKLKAAGLSLRKVAAELAQQGHYARNGAAFEAAQIQRITAKVAA